MSTPEGITREAAAHLALYTAVLAASQGSEDLPAPFRNKGLDHGLAETGRSGARVRAWLNIVDADPRPLTEILGDSDEGDMEFEAHARFEIMVSAIDDDARETAFARLLKALGNAVRADRTLGGACDDLTIGAVRRINLALDGVAQMKTAEISVAMLLTGKDLLD